MARIWEGGMETKDKEMVGGLEGSRGGARIREGDKRDGERN